MLQTLFFFLRPGSTIADIDLQFTNESTILEEQTAVNAFSDYVIMNGGTIGNYTVVEILAADSTMRCKCISFCCYR